MAGSLKQVLGVRLRAARQRSGLTQQELATRVARTPESISNIERGLQSPSIETLAELAKVLAVPITELFQGWAGDSTEPNTGRIALESRLRELARCLTDRYLAIAVAQMSAFKDHG